MTGRILVAIAAGLLVTVGLCSATIILVPSQYPTIQAGIDAAIDGDTVLVADGTYTGEGNKGIDFTGKQILVISESGPETCIIDCEEDGRGFHFHTDENPNSILYGFKVINGSVLGPAGFGGGIRCQNSSPTIVNCIFSDNSAFWNGGGICCESSSPIVDSCSFFNNRAVSTDWPGGGGGMAALANSHPAISNCDFNGNLADCFGGGIRCDTSNPAIVNCIFSNNNGYEGGGGMAICTNSHPTISDCDFTGNWNGGISIGYGTGCNPTIFNCVIGETHGYGICSLAGAAIISDCIISGNHCSGIYTDPNSEATISNCIVSGNSTISIGGGIQCFGNDIFSGNIIIANHARLGGGGIYCQDFSEPTIINNTISGNSTPSSGGGIYCDHSSATIIDNTIDGNTAGIKGGGIRCGYTSTVTISGNTIRNNSSQGYGSGIAVEENSSADLSNNVFSGNSATDLGGGLWCETNTNVTINKCTFSDNEAVSGGGIYCEDPASNLINCILWGNSPDQILGSLQVTYCNVMGGWPGAGNIEEDPLFVYPDQSDYRLQWGSLCIDAGSPDPIYNDPDGTAADMGAFYYDQSMAQRILLTPHNAPIEIPPEGGSFDFTIWLTNINPIALLINVWCDVTLPDGSIFGPVIGPVSVTLDSGVTVDRDRTQAVPAGAPTGVYFYNAYAIAEGDTSVDGFTFVKLGVDGLDRSLGWFNTGESFDDITSVLDDALIPEAYSLGQNYPNPFNPVTTIRYGLPEDTFVKLTIYDLLGRPVEVLVDGQRQAGLHEVSFDASQLASGLYIYRINAGEFTAVRKMILMR